VSNARVCKWANERKIILRIASDVESSLAISFERKPSRMTRASPRKEQRKERKHTIEKQRRRTHKKERNVQLDDSVVQRRAHPRPDGVEGQPFDPGRFAFEFRQHAACSCLLLLLRCLFVFLYFSFSLSFSLPLFYQSDWHSLTIPCEYPISILTPDQQPAARRATATRKRAEERSLL